MPKNLHSILTTAALAADKKTENLDPDDPETIPALKAHLRKKLIRKALIATAAGAVLTIIAVKLNSNDSDEDTETDVPQD